MGESSWRYPRQVWPGAKRGRPPRAGSASVPFRDVGAKRRLRSRERHEHSDGYRFSRIDHSPVLAEPDRHIDAAGDPTDRGPHGYTYSSRSNVHILANYGAVRHTIGDRNGIGNTSSECHRDVNGHHARTEPFGFNLRDGTTNCWTILYRGASHIEPDSSYGQHHGDGDSGPNIHRVPRWGSAFANRNRTDRGQGCGYSLPDPHRHQRRLGAATAWSHTGRFHRCEQ